jgi:hypothetical protein
VLLSYVLGPKPADWQFWPGAVVMMLIATIAAALVTSSGRFDVVCRGVRPGDLSGLCDDPLSVTATSTMNLQFDFFP